MTHALVTGDRQRRRDTRMSIALEPRGLKQTSRLEWEKCKLNRKRCSVTLVFFPSISSIFRGVEFRSSPLTKWQLTSATPSQPHHLDKRLQVLLRHASQINNRGRSTSTALSFDFSHPLGLGSSPLIVDLDLPSGTAHWPFVSFLFPLAPLQGPSAGARGFCNPSVRPM